MIKYTSTAATWQSWTITPAYYCATAATWGAWNGSTVTTSALNPWHAWADNAITVTTSTATIGATWGAWATPDNVARHRYAEKLAHLQHAYKPETAEERVAREAVELATREQRAREREVAAVARRVAISKADKLLESVLSDVQREQLRRDEAFLVRGQSGAVYRVRKGRGINVDEIARDTGDVVRTLCAYPGINVPDGDTMAAQKLMLEADEADFLSIAIKHQARGPKVSRAALEALLQS